MPALSRPIRQRRIENRSSEATAMDSSIPTSILPSVLNSAISEPVKGEDNTDGAFSRMPVEMTSKILHLTLEDIEDPIMHKEQLTTIQLVCNTFLQIVLGYSTFWSRLDSRMGPSQINMRLARSKSVPLHLHLHAHFTASSRPHLRQTLSILRAHGYRFEAAVVSIYVDQTVADTGDIGISEIVGWTWPALKSLTFDAAGLEDVFDVRELRWETPVLEDLICGGYHDSVSYPFVGPLKRLTLRPQWDYSGRSVVRMLSSLTDTLEELVVDFSSCAGVIQDEDDEEEQDDAENGQERRGDGHRPARDFTSLSHLHVNLQESSCDGTIFALLAHFDMSNAEKMEISTYPGYRTDISEEHWNAFQKILTQPPTKKNTSYVLNSILASDRSNGQSFSSDTYTRILLKK